MTAFHSTVSFLALLFLIHNLKADEVKKNEESLREEKQRVFKYTRPHVADVAFFAEPFHSQEEFDANWVLSRAKKDGVDDTIAKYDGKWSIQEPKENPIVGDSGLVLTSEAKHAAVASSLKTPFRFEEKPLIVQYEVCFQNKHECGGAYVKLLTDSPSLDLNVFGDKVEYSIMFGPDKCGGEGKLHFIFQHENPITHQMEEKHAKKPTGDFSKIFDDNKTHLLTLIVRPDNSFEILVDNKQVSEGSLLKDMTPLINPPKEVDDPEDKKPEDWDEREKIPDPAATKPEDWDEDAPKTILDASAKKPADWLDDEPELFPDPAAVKPADWDDEEDGEWEAPQINNPKCKAVGCGEWNPATIKNPNYKGKWAPPMVANPKYKGIWAPRKIENPEFFEDNNPFAMKPIAAVGFELWSMQSDILFDNIIIADDFSTVLQWTSQTWDIKHSKEVAAEPNAVVSMWKSFTDATEEKPWLWGVAIGAILLPLILIYIFCFPSKSDSAAVHKKTDNISPDDEVSEKSEDETTEESKPQEVNKKKIEETGNGEEEEVSSEENVLVKREDETTEESKPQEVNEKKTEETGNGEEEEVSSEENVLADHENTKPEREEEEEAVEETTKAEDGKDVEEEVPQSSPSPRTRASRRKTRKDT